MSWRVKAVRACIVFAAGACLASCDRAASEAPTTETPPAASENGAPTSVAHSAPTVVATEPCDMPAATGAGPSILEGVSNDGTYKLVLTPSPAPLPANALFELQVDVSAAAAAALPEDLAVAVDAWMPDHAHGMNVEPRIEKKAEGSFAARGMLFHMPGKWQLFVDLSSRGTTERAQFEIILP